MSKLSQMTLGQKGSFWAAAAVVSHTLWTSAAPAMTYPIYAREWRLSPTATTGIFAIYPLVVVFMLIGFGEISDYIGRRKTMLLGLGASLLGVLAFAIGPNVQWIFAGRALMGVGVGLSASPAAAAMVEFSRPGQEHRAGSIAAAAQALGLAAAVLVGGGLIQYAPFPAHLNFWVLFVVLLAIFGATWFLPHHTVGDASGRWKPKPLNVARGIRRVFTISAMAVISGYGIGAVMLSLGSQVAHDLIGSSNALLNGGAIAWFSVVLVAVGICAKRMLPNSAVALGGIATMTGMGLLALAADHHSFPLYLAASAASGAGYSLMFSGGLNLINTHAPSRHLGGTLSSLFFVAYLMQAIIAFSLGLAATRWGLQAAIYIGGGAIGTLSLAASILSLSFRRTSTVIV